MYRLKSASKLRRMSLGEVHKYTRTFAGRWITPDPEEPPEPAGASRRQLECEVDPHWQVSTRSGPRPPPLASSPPTRTGPGCSPSAAVAAKRRKPAHSVPTR